jgi:hypothetical protein
LSYSINRGLGDAGSLGLFAGLNVLAFILTFLLVEETKKRSLEDLDLIFAVPKLTFMRYQVATHLPWFFKYYFLRRKDLDKPSLYIDRVWGGPAYTNVDEGTPDEDDTWRGGARSEEREYRV